MRRVAVIGLGPSRDTVEFGAADWEYWGLPWSDQSPHFDRWFEMHPPEIIFDVEQGKRQLSYRQDLEESEVPVYMQQAYPDIPMALAYPFEAVGDDVLPGIPEHDRYGSSIAYMLALAIYIGAREIALYGVDLKDDAFDHQRPNLALLIGVAMGRGIKVHVPETAQIYNIQLGANKYDYPTRYGFLEAS